MKRDPGQTCRLLIFPLAILLALTACLPTSEYPIVVPGASVRDPALAGTWEGFMDDNSDAATLYFINADEDRGEVYPGGLDLIMISQPGNEQGPENWAVLYALSARINDMKFLSIEYRNDKSGEITGTERGFHLFMYKIDGEDKLIVRGVDEDVLTALIEDQQIKGTISKGKWFSDARLNASSPELVAFLKSIDVDLLFTESIGPFTRRKPQ